MIRLALRRLITILFCHSSGGRACHRPNALGHFTQSGHPYDLCRSVLRTFVGNLADVRHSLYSYESATNVFFCGSCKAKGFGFLLRKDGIRISVAQPIPGVYKIGMKRKIFLMFGLLFVGLGEARASNPLYLGISGQIHGLSQDQVMNDLAHTFTDPLNLIKPHLKDYFYYKVDGASRFSLGLILESLDSEGEAWLAEYVAQLESSGFHGQTFRFEKVLRIEEKVDLLAGLHRSANEFDQNSDIPRQFDLPSLSDWERFTNRIGDAFLSKNSKDFQSYLSWFFGGQDEFSKYAQAVLSHDDVVEADLNPTVVLESGASVDISSSVSPFFDLPIARSCWDPNYENGMCWKSLSQLAAD